RARPTVLAVAVNPDRDARTGLSAQAIHSILQGHVESRFVVDLGDAIEPLEPGATGRSARHGAHHRQHLVPNADHDTETSEVSRGLYVHIRVGFRIQEYRVRVESPEHAVGSRILDAG